MLQGKTPHAGTCRTGCRGRDKGGDKRGQVAYLGKNCPQKWGQSHLGLNRAQLSKMKMPAVSSTAMMRNQFIFFMDSRFFTFT